MNELRQALKFDGSPLYRLPTSAKNRRTEIVHNELNLIVLLDVTVTPGGPDLIDDQSVTSFVTTARSKRVKSNEIK